MTIAPTHVSRPRAVNVLPGYRLENLLGKGGMGEVYRAVQLSLGRPVAVKLLAAELAQDDSLVARFEKEAAALAALSHPNIVSIVDKGHANGTWYLVMELVDGSSLREVMRSPGGDPANSLRTVLEICRAIDYAHGRGIIHRDLKPENILFDDQAGHIAKVTDFGLAAFLDGDTRFNMTQDHSFMGTLSYMAPEQRVDAKSADHRADIYALGVILYEMVVGELPVGTFDPPSRKKPGLDRRLDAIIDRCLKPAPADRYQKVSELILDLEPLVPVTLSHPPRPVGRMARVAASARRLARTTLRTAAALLVIAAAGILAIALLRVSGSGSNRLSTAEALVAEPTPQGVLASSGRISREANLQRVTLGEGPDPISLITWGRAPRPDGRLLSFTASEGSSHGLVPPDPRNALGRAKLDLADLSEGSVRVSVEASAGRPSTAFLARLRNTAFGSSPEPRATLILAGSPGRYAAVTISSVGAPVAFTWVLGDRRGTMLGPPSPDGGRTRLELAVDAEGELRAFVGKGADRREVCEPVRLGAGWQQRYFGGVPAPAIGCLEGDCQFQGLTLEIQRVPEAPTSGGAPEALTPVKAGASTPPSAPAAQKPPAAKPAGTPTKTAALAPAPKVAPAAKPAPVTPATARKAPAAKPTAPAKKPAPHKK